VHTLFRIIARLFRAVAHLNRSARRNARHGPTRKSKTGRKRRASGRQRNHATRLYCAVGLATVCAIESDSAAQIAAVACAATTLARLGWIVWSIARSRDRPE
jgi:hypothetical protein